MTVFVKWRIQILQRFTRVSPPWLVCSVARQIRPSVQGKEAVLRQVPMGNMYYQRECRVVDEDVQV
jgi:hypothetical protein